MQPGGVKDEEQQLSEHSILGALVPAGIAHLRRLSRAGVLLFALTAAGCQAIPGDSLGPSNAPVTIDNVGQDDRRRRIAEAQHPKILQTYGGEYSDPKLERMIAKVVGRLTTVSDNPTQVYRISILDSPNVNAFALPGGYLYITRGLLALANDAAELATVISHEMAHVTANHGLLRARKEQEEGLTKQVASDLLAGDSQAKAAVIRSQLRLAQFSRNQELEADVIGIRSAGEAGYDPYAAARFLRSMTKYTEFRSVSGADDASLDFLATHPTSQRRLELARRHARAFGGPGIGDTDRDSYLNGIDGMLFGDRPDEGYVRGLDFLHPVLGIRFTVPKGFVIDNSAEAVTAAGPGDIAVRFDGVSLARGVPLDQYIASGWVSGLDPSSVRKTTINGLQAATARAEADGWQFDITVIRNGGQVYRLLTAAPLASNRLESIAGSVRSSFRRLTPTEKASLKPLRIRVVTVKPGQTAGSLAAMMSGSERKLDLFLLLNALAPGETVSAGQRVKIVTDS